MKLAKTAFWLSVALLAWILVRGHGELPATVASNFSGDGAVNSYMTKQQFLILETALMGMLVLTFAGMPWLLRRMPDGLINMPHKDYWLAPERRRESLAMLGQQLLWMGTATVVFMAYALELVIQANLDPAPRLGGGFVWALGLYLAAVLAWTVWLIRHFNRVPASR